MQNTAFHKTAPALPGALDVSRDFAAALLRAPAAVFGRIVARQRRAEERAQLRKLTDHQLHDMGLTRAQVEAMARKARWSRPV